MASKANRNRNGKLVPKPPKAGTAANTQPASQRELPQQGVRRAPALDTGTPCPAAALSGFATAGYACELTSPPQAARGDDDVMSQDESPDDVPTLRNPRRLPL